MGPKPKFEIDIGESKAAWKTTASADAVANAFKAFTAKKEEPEETKKTAEIPKFIKPLLVEKPEISRDGNMTIKFNQKLKVPSFLTKKRQLVGESR